MGIPNNHYAQSKLENAKAKHNHWNFQYWYMNRYHNDKYYLQNLPTGQFEMLLWGHCSFWYIALELYKSTSA